MVTDPISARGRLFGIAYRILGSAGDAEDAVQSAYVRFEEHRGDDIRDPVAWLVTVTTRLAIDRARELARQKETYVGEWLPEPLFEDDPGEDVARADDLAMGFLHVLERLRPEERSALLLHDVFGYSHAEVARILEKGEDAVRQMVARARHRIHAERPRFAVDYRKASLLAERFVKALRSADVGEIRQVLATDVVHIADGGGVVRASINPVVGIDRVSRLLVGLRTKHWASMEMKVLTVNGLPAIGLFDNDVIRGVIGLDFRTDCIAAVYSQLNPNKLH